MKKTYTLCMFLRDNKILLGIKKRGFGEGRWNGFGGKVADGESIKDAAKREIKEEVGLEVNEMQKVGILDFSFESEPKTLEVHIFKVTDFFGEPTETEEMRPEWFDLDQIPYAQMWSDDEYWLPLLLQNKIFKGALHFDQPSTADYSAKIISQQLEEVSNL